MKVRVLLMLILAASASTGFAQEWTSFQNGGVIENESWQFPKEWSPDKGIAWKKELAGYGQSTPIVFADMAYITSVTGAKKETINIEAFSISDGTRKWIHSQANSTLQDNTVMISRAAPSPAADDEGVIAMFEGGNLIALDHTGKVRWQRDLAAEFGDVEARHGLAASLEQDDKHVYVWVERSANPYVTAILKSDGSEAWKVAGVGSTSWGSPRLIEVSSSKHLVLSAIGKIVGLDPENGKQLWAFDDIQGNSSTTPIPLAKGRFLIGASGGRGGPPTKPCCGVIKIESVDGAWLASWLWSTKKTTCSFGSPVATDGRAWFVNRSGIVNCHDIETGEEIFAGRLPGGSIWATPLVAGDLLYFFGKNGVTSIVEDGSSLNIVGENRLWAVEPKQDPDSSPAGQSGSVLYAATFDGSRLLVRRGDRLYAIDGLTAQR